MPLAFIESFNLNAKIRSGIDARSHWQLQSHALTTRMASLRRNGRPPENFRGKSPSVKVTCHFDAILEIVSAIEIPSIGFTTRLAIVNQNISGGHVGHLRIRRER